MYPTQEIMDRCCVMAHIEGEELLNLNNMWDSVKVGYMKYSTMLIIVLAVLLVVAVVITLHVLNKKGIKIKFRKRNYGTLVKSEKIN